MKVPASRRIPIMPTVASSVGLLVGIVGLLMVLLGIGVISPTIVNIPGINLHIQTATPGIVVMVIGFSVTIIPLVMAYRVAEKQAENQQTPDAVEATYHGWPRIPPSAPTE